MSAARSAAELGRYPNHPLAGDSRVCKNNKCQSINTMPPSYPGDYFDCLDCGHSWPATDKQTERMFHRVEFKGGKAVRVER
jgi:hypothetical protein